MVYVLQLVLQQYIWPVSCKNEFMKYVYPKFERCTFPFSFFIEISLNFRDKLCLVGMVFKV
jgi:hypothetical protein